MQTYIRSINEINGNQALAMVHVVHDPHTDFRAEFAASVSAACQNDMRPVAGSASVLEEGRGHAMVRVILNRTEDVIPMESVSSAFIAVSSNMYMDADERMWSVRHGADGDVLVRQSCASDQNDLIEMIRSVSSASDVALASQNPTAHRAFVEHNSSLSAAVAGDMASYVSQSGDMKVGFIVANVADDGSFVALSSDNVEERIEARQMVAVLSGDLIAEDAFPPVDSVSKAAGFTVDKLVDYYSKVYSYRPDYLAQLIERIRGYGF